MLLPWRFDMFKLKQDTHMYNEPKRKTSSFPQYIFQFHKMDSECSLIRCVKNVVDNGHTEIKFLFTTFVSYFSPMVAIHLEECVDICYNRTNSGVLFI